MGSPESRGAKKPAGTVEAIYITSSAGEPMHPLWKAEAIAGQGLAGDRYLKGTGYYSKRPLPDGSREITLVEAEELEKLERETGIRLDPSESRRNVLTRSIRVNDLIGKQFRIGEEVLCEGLRICEPCTYLEKLTGKRVMRPLVHKGGLRARIISGGAVKVGDGIRNSSEGPVENVEPIAAGVRSSGAATAAAGEIDPAEVRAEGILRRLASPSSGDGAHYLENEDAEAIEYTLVSEDLELDDFLGIRVVAVGYLADGMSGHEGEPGLMKTFLVSAV